MCKQGFGFGENGWLAATLVCGSLLAGGPLQSASGDVLRLATSTDGRRFHGTGVLLSDNASSPNLIRSCNVDLLTVFDLLSDDGDGEVRTMAV